MTPQQDKLINELQHIAEKNGQHKVAQRIAEYALKIENKIEEAKADLPASHYSMVECYLSEISIELMDLVKEVQEGKIPTEMERQGLIFQTDGYFQTDVSYPTLDPYNLRNHKMTFNELPKTQQRTAVCKNTDPNTMVSDPWLALSKEFQKVVLCGTRKEARKVKNEMKQQAQQIQDNLNNNLPPELPLAG